MNGVAPLRVMMVSASFHPYVGGAEKQALELSVALRARGIGVQVATRQLGGLAAREEIRGVPVYRLWRAGSGVLDAVTFMLSLGAFLWWERRNYDVIHVHLAGSPALAACAMGRLLGKRVFVKLGGGAGIGELAASSRTMFGRIKLRALSWLSPQFVAVAGELVEEARRYLGDVPVCCISNGVDTERYKPVSNPQEKVSLRQRLGWPGEALIFLYVGRLSAEKGLARFAEVWAQSTRSSTQRCFLAVVGAGPEEASTLSAIEASGALGRARVLPPMNDVEDAYEAADVFVLPSVSEGLSNALLEAMSSGCAILGSRVGGTPEAVEEGRSGLLFSARDDQELHAHLRQLIDRPALAAAMGAHARERVVERFSLQKLAERYELLYRCG